MKKSKYFKVVLSILLLFNFVQPELRARTNNGEDILQNFLRLESNYIRVAKERLSIFLNEDTILKESFLSGDSSNYRNLKIIVRPILKFKKEAENFTYDQDIFNLIEFDTINYHCVAQFYLNEKLLFIISRGHNECDLGIIACGTETPEWCPGDYYFSQEFYKSNEINDCLGTMFGIINDSVFIFFIDFLQEGFIIDDNMIRIYPENYNSALLQLLDEPNEFIKRRYYGEEWIRHCARECPAGGKK